MTQAEIADIAASFQAAVIDVLVKKTKRAAQQIKAKSVLMGGGVGCNGALRDAMEHMCKKEHLTLMIAPKKYCTDNAAMVASLAYYKYQARQFADLTLEPKATSD
jgi:N6-L-threonylcarbamoyladenine synthase